VRAFTARFPGTGAHDESEQAQTVAKAVGAEHVIVDVTARDFWTRLPAIAAALDDPVADYAAVPTFLLAEEAAKGLKVVLTGEGGDELFAGYGRYRSAIRPRWLGGRPMRSRGILDGLGVLREALHWRDGFAAAAACVRAGEGTPLQKAQALDCADWLPNDLLIKLDRTLMAHGLEGRTPFLDSVVAEFAFRLPDGLKIRGSLGKYILRRWLEKALPASDPFAKKRGFTVPVADWLMPRARALAPLISASGGIAEICHTEEAERLFRAFGERGGKKTGAACWQLLFYALWHAIHVECRPAQGDVFAVLGPR
jgi:asparagine synthase (glutamine-hydrolysing)